MFTECPSHANYLPMKIGKIRVLQSLVDGDAVFRVKHQLAHKRDGNCDVF